jgi:hypothetical protein
LIGSSFCIASAQAWGPLMGEALKNYMFSL